jgi:hypothetical protein
VGSRAGLEVNKKCRKTHNEELHNLNASPNNSNKIRENKMGEVCSKQASIGDVKYIGHSSGDSECKITLDT